MRRIAVLTSGVEVPGMNAAIQAVVRGAEAAGVRTIGARDGFAGLIAGRLEPLDARAVAGILHLGGSILGSGRSPGFRTSEGRRQALTHLDLAEVDGLVAIGGDGTLRGAEALSRSGHLRVVGVPASIHNDAGGSAACLGFDSAVNAALEAIDREREAAAAGHAGPCFVAVAGRTNGWLALQSGLGSGATEVVVPERPADVARIRRRVRAALERGTRFVLVVVAEGAARGGVQELADAVTDGLEEAAARVVALDRQVPRRPSQRDRLLGARLGDAAVQALWEGADRVVVGEVDGALARTPLARARSEPPRPPDWLFELTDRLAP
jgi:6-phosphofructokinase 1